MSEKARIDPGLIASLRESSRPLRPEASLTTPSAEAATGDGDLQAALQDLAARLERVEQRLARLDGYHHLDVEVDGHTLFVPTAGGYTTVEQAGPPPRPGNDVSVDGSTYRALSFRRSPFPGDLRPCVVVEPLEAP